MFYENNLIEDNRWVSLTSHLRVSGGNYFYNFIFKLELTSDSFLDSSLARVFLKIIESFKFSFFSRKNFGICSSRISSSRFSFALSWFLFCRSYEKLNKFSRKFQHETSLWASVETRNQVNKKCCIQWPNCLNKNAKFQRIEHIYQTIQIPFWCFTCRSESKINF